MKKSVRTRSVKRVSQGGKAGLPPGTPVFIGERRQDEVKIELFSYSRDHLEEVPDASLDDCQRLKNDKAIVWVNVTGIHDTQAIERLA